MMTFHIHWGQKLEEVLKQQQDAAQYDTEPPSPLTPAAPSEDDADVDSVVQGVAGLTP